MFFAFFRGQFFAKKTKIFVIVVRMAGDEIIRVKVGKLWCAVESGGGPLQSRTLVRDLVAYE